MEKKIKIWGLLTEDAFCEIGDFPPHEAEITLTLLEFEKIIRNRLEKIGIQFSFCKKCGKEMLFLPTKKGKTMPVTLGLISHFADCEFANKFRK